MNNFYTLQNIIIEYMSDYGVTIPLCISNLHDVSKNESCGSAPCYVYNGRTNLEVIDMDRIAAIGYKRAKKAEGKDNIVNTADGFLINRTNDWYFLEFKDSEVKADNSNLKNNILKKAYSNWYMLLDILYHANENGLNYPTFTYDQPVEFARKHIQYILVCSKEKNPLTYDRIKACRWKPANKKSSVF